MSIYPVHSDQSAITTFRNLRKNFFAAVGLLAMTVMVSTIVFVFLNHDPDLTLMRKIFLGIWRTLNLVSTVGSLGELKPSEQAWALLVIIFGLGAVLYGFGLLQALLHGGEVRKVYERRKMKKILDEISNHIIICGYGVVGLAVAHDLKRHGVPIVVIDKNREALRDAEESGFHAILADSTKEETLKQAGIERALGLIAALNSDSSNVYLILIAREASENLRIISRAESSEASSTLKRAGADRVIVPGKLAALQLSHLMLKPKVSEFIAAATGEGEYDFAEMAMSEHPALTGKSLRELNLPKSAEAIVISIVGGDGSQEFNPSADRKLTSEDTLIIVCKEGGLERIAKMENA